MSSRELLSDGQPTLAPRTRQSFSSVSRPAPVIRPRTVRHAVKSAITRFAGHNDAEDSQNLKSMFLKECSLYTCFLLAGWVDATPGALLPAIRERWDLSFVLVSLLFVGVFFGCIIAASCVPSCMDRFGFGKVISSAAVLSLVFPVVFLTMPPFPVLVVAMMFNGAANATLEALVNVWISQRPRAHVRLGVLHFLYGLGALSSPLAAIPFLERRRGVAFQYFFCVSLALGLSVLSLVTVAFKLQRDEHVEGPSQPSVAETVTELQPRNTPRIADDNDKGSTSANTPAPQQTNLDLMPITSISLTSGSHTVHASTNAQSGFHKLKAVVKQQKVQLLATFCFVYVGTEVSVGGWSSSYLILVRNQSNNANLLVSGFWAGIAFGRILLIPVTAWLGDELACFIYLNAAIGLQILVWLVPNIVANAVALALLGVFLGPAFPTMIRIAEKSIRPRAHLTAAISFISTSSAAGMALVPLIVGLASQAAPQGIRILAPMLVGLLALQVLLWLVTNREYFIKRFLKRDGTSDDYELDDVDRLD